jgi:glycosyltransferase involved in cell wall biosynthesis
MKLLIAIPALNEEANIENIIQRCLGARDEIIRDSPITEVAITVVSDGSTDRTVELARHHTDSIRLIVFEKNQGYGAAIHHAWQGSDADLLAFLDADGTCDPRFFANLAQCLFEKHADVVLGCRLNADTKMPLLRQAGNLFFAGLLTLLSGRRIRDTASGMRIVRREAYNRLRPLPSGLHFTPAMSARALLDREARVKLVEIDMPYHERVGDSKLNVGRDGLRFLGVITKTALIYRPVGLAAVLLTGGAVTFAASLYLIRLLKPALPRNGYSHRKRELDVSGL